MFFFEDCRFYASRLGSTLNEILDYQLRRNTLLTKQPIPVKIAAIITVFIFMIVLINDTLTIIIVSRKQAQEPSYGYQ